MAHVEQQAKAGQRASAPRDRDADDVTLARGRALAFASLVENSGELIALTDLDGRLLLNATGRKLLGLDLHESLDARSLSDFLPPADAARFFDIEIPAAKARGRWTGEGRLRNCRSGQGIDVLINSFLIDDPQSRRPLCLPTVQRDVTAQKRDAEAISASEQRFRQLAENIEEAFWVSEVDPRRVIYASPAYSKIFGQPCEALYADPNSFLEATHPEDRQRVIDSIPRVRLGGYDETFRIVRPDGSIRTIRSRAFPVRNDVGMVYRVAGLAEDITNTKQVEEELLAERRFLEHLLQVQEGERKLIAYDIHDGFLQSVIAAVMHLEGLGVDPAVRECTREKLHVPIDLLRGAIEEARRMISGLRPPIIDEEGLVAAIQFLINEKRAGSTKIAFRCDVQFDRLEPVVEGGLFRIVQEALANVIRHSEARLAEVALEQKEDRLRLTIEDWGIGFDPNEVSRRQFGLRGIRERAKLFGGQATIQSTPGRGTKISVELPLKAAFSHLPGSAGPAVT